MNRTLVTTLHPTPEQALLLQQTMHQHTACFNAVAQEGFTTQCRNGVELHKRTYFPLRSVYPTLPAQLVCAARVKATEAVKIALTWKAKKARAFSTRVARAAQRGKPLPLFIPVRCPRSVLCPIRYDQQSSWVTWETATTSLATSAGRVEVAFTIPFHARK